MYLISSFVFSSSLPKSPPRARNSTPPGDDSDSCQSSQPACLLGLRCATRPRVEPHMQPHMQPHMHASERARASHSRLMCCLSVCLFCLVSPSRLAKGTTGPGPGAAIHPLTRAARSKLTPGRCASSLPTACKHLPNALVGIFEAGPRAWRPCLLGAGCWDPIHRSCCTHARTHARTSHLWISPNLYASYMCVDGFYLFTYLLYILSIPTSRA
ncbi:hypothetical protein IWX49DRAFT_398469 [Phyllosticta citricarpa]